MMTIREYVMVTDLEQAYTLNQTRSNAVIGGMIWMKMGNKAVNKAIDLSNLALNTITETETQFTIGAMTTLRQLETDERLRTAFGNCLADSVRHIVGVQLRNCATVGGSVVSRFGFSDVLTVLLALGAQVELYKAGTMPLEVYANLPYDRDILVNVILPKNGQQVQYLSLRNTKTDLPVLTCAVTKDGAGYAATIGARPHRAQMVRDAAGVAVQSAEQFAVAVSEQLVFGSNERASADYRKHLCKVLIKRGVQAIEGGK